MSATEEAIMEERRRVLRTYWGLPARKTLVLVHPFEPVPDCFIHALEQEFPWLSVALVVGWRNLPVSFKDPPALVLVDSRIAGQAEEAMELLRESQPGLPYAVMCDDPRDPMIMADAFMPAEGMHGLLPMNTKLDLWLSIVGLMLHGGDYYPPVLLREMAGQAGGLTLRTVLRPLRGSGREPHAAAQWNDLTEREQQVLASVARGRPNKLVAAEFGLSEHTVKIHIHNIIRKLRVHNRTEAAALYLQAMAQDRRRP